MELINKSRLPMEVTTALDKSGREHLVMVAKATYLFGDEIRPPELAQECHPIVYSDIFVGEPGLSAPIYESDLSLSKRRCDVILDATAHAPEGRPVTELDVAVRVGPLFKQFLVVGDRVWQRGLSRVSPSRPQAFSSMPLHYGRAFGGSLVPRPDGVPDSYAANPVGRGFCSDPRADIVDEMPMPNTEEIHGRIGAPNDSARPLSFGPIGRHWHPRKDYAGTYDAHWRAEVFPLLPEDFDETFFQCAPPDQQTDFIQGGEQVELRHLVSGQPRIAFKLPKPDLALKLLYESQTALELRPRVDTVFIEPDQGRFTLVYRATVALDRRGLFGIRTIAAGPVCKRWWNAQVLGTADCGCGGDSDKDEGPEETEELSLQEREALQP